MSDFYCRKTLSSVYTVLFVQNVRCFGNQNIKYTYLSMANAFGLKPMEFSAYMNSQTRDSNEWDAKIQAFSWFSCK